MNHRVSKPGVAVALVACTTLVGAAAVTAHAEAGGSKGSTETFLLSYGLHESEVVVAHGPIVGGGKDVQGNKYDTLHLGGGTIRINHPDSKSHFHQHYDPTTCFGSFSITGTYTLDHGTGQYAGVTGHGTYTVTGNAVSPKKKSGACNSHANPRVEAAYIKASGPITK